MIRIGIDFGGTKIEAAALDESGGVIARLRQPNPGGYDAAIATLKALISDLEAQVGETVDRIGIGIPGSLSPTTGLMRNANSTWLNGRAFPQDVEAALGKAVRLTNDANCLAVSEAAPDGVAAGKRLVFAAIIGTGCGGGLAVDGRVIDGANGVAGEWGHTPLPWPKPDEYPGPRCWCGRENCLELWVSGTGLRADYERKTGEKPSGGEIVKLARAGDATAVGVVDRYVDRLARALAVVVDIVDPDAIVLGGGMSNTAELYERLPALIETYAFTDRFVTPVVHALHGDSSGVRGAAWLWPPA